MMARRSSMLPASSASQVGSASPRLRSSSARGASAATGTAVGSASTSSPCPAVPSERAASGAPKTGMAKAYAAPSRRSLGGSAGATTIGTSAARCSAAESKRTCEGAWPKSSSTAVRSMSTAETQGTTGNGRLRTTAASTTVARAPAPFAPRRLDIDGRPTGAIAPFETAAGTGARERGRQPLGDHRQIAQRRGADARHAAHREHADGVVADDDGRRQIAVTWPRARQIDRADRLAAAQGFEPRSRRSRPARARTRRPWWPRG